MYNANAKSLQTSTGAKRRRPKVSLLKRLVTEAVSSQPLKGLVLRDIYSYVQQHSSEYTDSDVVWHKNVRFLLSSNEYFVKSNERNPNGSGFYWKFDDEIYQKNQNRAETRRSKARIIPVNTQNEHSEAKSSDQRRSSVSRPPANWTMNSEPMLIEQKDFNICKESRDIASYPLVNVSDIQPSSYSPAESGYPWPDRTHNAWNQIPSFSQRYESSSSSLEQYYRFPVSSETGGNTSLSFACPESAIFQRETPRFPSAPCSVGELSRQYLPSQLARLSRSSYDNQVSEYDAVSAAAAQSTRADCAFQTGPSLYAQSMHIYISQDPLLNSSGRKIARSLRSYDESSFRDQGTHQAWPHSSNQYDEVPQFGDSFEINRVTANDQIGYRNPPIHGFNYTPYLIN